MTVSDAGTFRGTFRTAMPGKPYLAARAIRAEETAAPVSSRGARAVQ